ncbi:MAG: HAMP domain-containing sensor histidine kinase, partial [Desulfobacterales bacterium]
SKTEAGAGQLERRKLDIAGLVCDACDLFQSPAEDKNLKLDCRAPENVIIYGDMRLIQRMIANLLDNAIKYTPSNGSIDVGLRIADDQSVLISVKDTGIGISKHDLAHIFERFYRCDPSRSQAGTGLGLSFARAVARAHDGDITVTSAPDQGSAFTVMLPQGQPG